MSENQHTAIHAGLHHDPSAILNPCCCADCRVADHPEFVSGGLAESGNGICLLSSSPALCPARVRVAHPPPLEDWPTGKAAVSKTDDTVKRERVQLLHPPREIITMLTESDDIDRGRPAVKEGPHCGAFSLRERGCCGSPVVLPPLSFKWIGPQSLFAANT